MNVTTASFELFIWIVFIIISMLAQAKKSSKEFKESRPAQDPPQPDPARRTRPAAPGRQPHLEPVQELQDFLETLTGASPQERERTALDFPKQVRKRTRSEKRSDRPAEQETPKPVFAGDSLRKEPANTSSKAPVPVVDDTNYALHDHGAEEELRLRNLRNALGRDLVNKSSLKKAVLLQEILNPPLSMRMDRTQP